MAFQVLTDEEKIDLVDRMIAARAAARDDHGRRDLKILKEIAKDIRARLPGAADAVIRELEGRLKMVEQTRTPLGHDANSLRHVGQMVLGFWPTIRAGLLKLSMDAASRPRQNPADDSDHKEGWR